MAVQVKYKYIQSIQSFARRNKSSIWGYYETSHGKSKSHGLGGVVKDIVKSFSMFH